MRKQNALLKTFLSTWLLLLTVAATAQQPSPDFESISIEKGLSQGMVFDILQDSEGFLWVATKDGLNRYDGYGFKVFTNDPYNPFSLSSNTVLTLFEDSKGRIWAGTESAGLNVFDKKTGRFHRIRHLPEETGSLSGNKITRLCEDANGNILAAADGAGLNVLLASNDFFDEKKLPQIRRVTLPDQMQVAGMVKDAKGRVWVSSASAIYRLEPADFSLTKAVDKFYFEAAFANPDGSIWSTGNLQPPFLWDGQTASPLFEGVFGAVDLCVHPDGRLWFAHYDGLYVFDLKKWTPGKPLQWAASGYDDMYSLSMTCLALDKSGMVWAGTRGYGLRKINPFHSRFRHDAVGLSVRNIVPAPDGSVYLGAYPYLWRRLINGNLEGEESLRGFFQGEVLENLFITKSGEHWAMNIEPRLLRKLPGGGVVKLPFSTTDYWRKQPLLEDHRGNIWQAGYEGKLLRVEPATGKVDSFDFSKPAQQMPPESPTTALYEDSDGTLWIGTQEGFVKTVFSNGKPNFTWFKNNPNDRNSLNYNHVSCFLDDPKSPSQFLWICTKGGGLNRIDKKTSEFLHLTTDDGLPNNVVYGILADDAGNLWGSTNRGIFCLTVDDGWLTVEGSTPSTVHRPPSTVFRNFTKADGLQDDEFNTGAYAKMPNGNLAFGGVNGLNVFDPEEILSSDFMPNVFITSILVNNQPVTPGDATGVLKNTIETSEGITLTHLQDILTLEFSSLDFTVPGQNKYRYQLLGADDAWVESGTRRSATYLHLPSGMYTFQVQGSNSQGIWSEHVAALKIKVLPPWWRSWWAYLGYLLLLLAGIRAYFRFSVNRAKLQEQLAYETREAGRVKELDAVKTQLYTNITHEFRTPLTVILGMTRQLAVGSWQSAVGNKEEARLTNGLKMIDRNGQSLLKLVNEMLDLSKLKSGKMTLQHVQGDVVTFLRYIVESFHSLAESQKKQLHFLADLDSLYIDYDPEKLRQIVSNLLSNALKYTPEGGHIYFSVDGPKGLLWSGLESADGIDTSSNILRIKVKDTGIGIPEGQLHSIFERFYQVDDSHTRQGEGTGIGLALTKELVKLMEGEISVKSPPTGMKKGSEFTVVLPVRLSPLTPKGEPQWQTPVNFSETQDSKTASRLDELGSPLGVRGESVNPLLLLVEDNPDVVAYIASCLPGYRLAVGKDGQEGLEIATEIIPDLIISDVMMPVMDGFELCRRLRNDERTSHIPIIMLTAKADLDSKLEGLEQGADAYLEKPFNKEELLVRIKKLLELRSQLRHHYQKVAGLAATAVAENILPEPEKTEDAFVKKVREAVEAHLEDFDFNVEQLCRAIHLSHSQLHRKLDALTGFSPNQFIRSVRLNKAKTLLQNHELSITAVAFDSGFNDPGYFARVFKQEFGLTPQEWRGKNRLDSTY